MKSVILGFAGVKDEKPTTLVSPELSSEEQEKLVQEYRRNQTCPAGLARIEFGIYEARITAIALNPTKPSEPTKSKKKPS